MISPSYAEARIRRGRSPWSAPPEEQFKMGVRQAEAPSFEGLPPELDLPEFDGGELRYVDVIPDPAFKLPEPKPKPVLSLAERTAIAFGADRPVETALSEARARRGERFRERELDIKAPYYSRPFTSSLDLEAARQRRKDFEAARRGAAATGDVEFMLPEDPLAPRAGEAVSGLEDPEARERYLRGIAGKLPQEPRQPVQPWREPEGLDVPADYDYVPGKGYVRRRAEGRLGIGDYDEGELSKKGWFVGPDDRLHRDYSVMSPERLRGAAFDDLTLNGQVYDAASRALELYEQLGEPDLGVGFAVTPSRVASETDLAMAAEFVAAMVQLRRYLFGAAVTIPEAASSIPLIATLERGGQPPRVIKTSLRSVFNMSVRARQRILEDARAAGYDVRGFEGEVERGEPKPIRQPKFAVPDRIPGGIYRDPETGEWRSD